MRITNTKIEIFTENETLIFGDDKVKKCFIHEEIDLISDRLVPKTAEASLLLDLKQWTVISAKLGKFQKLTVKVYIRDDAYSIDETKDMGIFYIDSWKRDENNILFIKSVGYLAYLDSRRTKGSYVYDTSSTAGHNNITVKNWAKAFFRNAGADFTLAPSFSNIYLTGTLPPLNYERLLKTCLICNRCCN